MASCWKSAKRLFHVHRQLLSLKATVFFLYGAIFSLIPFLKIHADYIGLSIPETTTVYAVLLIASFVGPPIAGYFTDKVGKFKLVFSVVIIITVLSHNCLLLVPRVSANEKKSAMNLMCTSSGIFVFTDVCHIPSRHCPYAGTEDTILDFKDCRIDCKDPKLTGPFPRQIVPSENISSEITDDFNPQICYGINYITKQSEECKSLEELVESNLLTLSASPRMYIGKSGCIHRVIDAFWGKNWLHMPNCPAPMPGCRLACDIDLKYLNDSSMTCLEKTGDANVTFFTYFILRLICMMTLGASLSLMEAAILVKAKQRGGDYGKQRVWGIIAKAVLIPLSGYFIQLSTATGHPAFLPPFFMFDILFCLALVLVVTTLNIESPAQPQLKVWTISDLLRRWEALLLYLAVFCLGAFYGFLDSFLSPFLLDFGKSAFLLDVSRNVGRLVCIPTMFFADTIMNKVGRVNILIAAFACYALQMLIYSLIGNPWWFLALEVLKFFTSCLKVASVVTLANTLAPPNLVATMQGLIHCLQYGTGSGIGHLIGGFITDNYSTRASLRVFGIFSGLLGFVYGVTYYVIRNKMRAKREPTNGSVALDPQFEDLCLKTESRV